MRHVRPVENTRSCSRCGVIKPIVEFRPWSTDSGDIAFESSCLECAKERSRLNALKYAKEHSASISQKRAEKYKTDQAFKERAVAKSRDYYRNNRDKCLARDSEYAERNKDKIGPRRRNYHLVRSYGLTIADYEIMLTNQEGKCAICKTTTPGGHAGLFHVDHCHITKAVRGLLCHKCNIGLGMFSDSQETMTEAIRYLSTTSGEVR